LFILYHAFRRLRLWFRSRNIVVEVSAHPLQPGQTTQLYVSYQPGYPVEEQLGVKLVCRQTVEEVTTRKGEDRRRHRTTVVYEAVLAEPADLPRPYPARWEQTLPLALPTEAWPTIQQPLYDPVGWAIVVWQPSSIPSFEIDYPIEIVTDSQ
jgi:hypothetical protein